MEINEQTDHRKRKYTCLGILCGMVTVIGMAGSNIWSSSFSREQVAFAVVQVDPSVSRVPYSHLPAYPLHNISFTSDAKINALNLEPLPFLPHFRSPCWYERVPKRFTYSSSALLRRKRRRPLADLEGIWDLGKVIRQRTSQPPHIGWRLRCLPYFYVAGFSKCGTSDLFWALTTHNDTARPYWKEVAYWNWERWKPSLRKWPKPSDVHKNLTQTNSKWNVQVKFDDYLDFFDAGAEKILRNPEIRDGKIYHKLILGEGTPSYGWSNKGWRGLLPNVYQELGAKAGEPVQLVPHIIHMLTPKAKFIFILRDPVSRLYSEYFFFDRDINKSKAGFAKRAIASVQRLTNCLKAFSSRHCLYNETHSKNTRPLRLHVGVYAQFLQDWMSVFPQDQILILRFEDYITNETAVMDRAFRFLGLESIAPSAYQNLPQWNSRSNTNREVGDMDDKTRTLLQDFYRPWNRKLEQFLYEKGIPWTRWEY